MTVRPALAGRILMVAVTAVPIVFLFEQPSLAVVDIAVAVLLALLALAVWRLHIYADAKVVGLRGGLRARHVNRDQVRAIAISSPLPLNVAFLGPGGQILLNVPIGATIPHRELVKLSDYLHVPLLARR